MMPNHIRIFFLPVFVGLFLLATGCTWESQKTPEESAEDNCIKRLKEEEGDKPGFHIYQIHVSEMDGLKLEPLPEFRNASFHVYAIYGHDESDSIPYVCYCDEEGALFEPSEEDDEEAELVNYVCQCTYHDKLTGVRDVRVDTLTYNSLEEAELECSNHATTDDPNEDIDCHIITDL